MKTLKKFEFKEFGAKSQYDWDTLLDGRIFQLEEGKDYTCKASTFAAIGKRMAVKQGKLLRTSKVEGGIVIQAVPNPNANGQHATEQPAVEGQPAASA